MANEGERVEIRALFDRVRGAPREQWEALLDAERLAGTGPEVIAGVRHLLGFVTAGPAALTGDIPTALVEQRARVERLAADAVPAQIGRYRIVRVLGEGGMGTVYEAQQESPRRTVALKVIRAGYLSGQMLRRFEHESHVLGRLQHPGIAQVYEAGTVQDERGNPMPFFAMEFIKGVPLTDYAGQKNLGTGERLDLIARVCDAVYHAHQKGVIHRDLKPANILVDESGQPKVLDFGVARATDSDLQATTVRTDIGQLVGTVPYMSPEQVGGDPDDLDTRSDVYALGVIAYELLAGRRPYDLQKKLIHEAARIIREEEPTRLSSINRTLRGDVETIVAKALEKEKTRRYQSAESLAGDIRHYLKDEPIAARPASTWYQLSKFSRRNKGLVAGVTVAFLALTLGLAGTVWKALEAERERDFAKAETLRANDRAVAAARAEESARAAEAEQRRLAASEAEQRRAAETQRDKAEKIAEFMSDTLEGAGPSVALGRDITMLKEMMDAAAARIEKGDLKDAPEAELRLRLTIGNTYRELSLYPQAEQLLSGVPVTADLLFPGDNPTRALCMLYVAELKSETGDLEEAATLCRAALEIYEHLPAGDPADRAGAREALANMMSKLGQLDDAIALHREALESFRRLFSTDNRSVANCLNSLGADLAAHGDFQDAEQAARESLDIKGRLYHGDHPDLVSGLNALGTVLAASGRFEDAAVYAREALEMARRLFPADNRLLAFCLCNVGELCVRMRHVEEAEPLFRESLDMTRRLFPGDHPDVAIRLNHLGSLQQHRGALSEAAMLFRESLGMQRRLFPGDHPDIAATLNNLGFTLQSLGDLNGAEPLFLEALEMLHRLYPGDHPFVAMTLNNLGSLYEGRGDLSKAELYYRQSLDIQERLFPGGHLDLAIGLHNLGKLLGVRGDHAAAEPVLRRSISIFEDVLGAGNWYAAATRVRLGVSLTAQNKFTDAESEFTRAGSVLASEPAASPDARTRWMNANIALYESWDKAQPGKGYDAKAAEWKTKLEALLPPPEPAEANTPK